MRNEIYLWRYISFFVWKNKGKKKETSSQRLQLYPNCWDKIRNVILIQKLGNLDSTRKLNLSNSINFKSMYKFSDGMEEKISAYGTCLRINVLQSVEQ